MLIRRRTLAAGLFFASLLLISASAQMEAIDAPISVAVNPKVALPGAPITLSDQTPPIQDGAKVSVLIHIEQMPRPANGKEAKPIQVDVAVNAKSGWALVLKNNVQKRSEAS